MTLVERLRDAWKSASENSLLISEAADRIEQLEAENAALREDAERLDWLLNHHDATICSGGAHGPFNVWFRYSNRVTEEAKTPRSAIDAARSQA